MSSRKIKAWVEAMRMRTLPVSVAGVITAGGCAALYGKFNLLPFAICLVFAVVAQIVSNFANEYFDFRNGLDRKGREGFRRGVTEGDISPRAMKRATFALLLLDCLLGCTLIFWGGWWLIAVGIAIALFAIGYSAGPYPLSHHGLGELAVILFFGIVPVVMTTYLQTGSWEMMPATLPMSVAIGFLGANVLVVNNYRDAGDDAKAGKHTLAVIFGRDAMPALYLANGFIAVLFIELATMARIPYFWQAGPLIYLNIHYILWQEMRQSSGRELNPILGKTAMLMLGLAVWMTVALAVG